MVAKIMKFLLNIGICAIINSLKHLFVLTDNKNVLTLWLIKTKNYEVYK